MSNYDSGVEKPPKESLPAPSQPTEEFIEFLKEGRQDFLDEAAEDGHGDDDEALHGVSHKHPALSSQPPITTTMSDAKAKLLKEMPKLGGDSYERVLLHNR